MARQQVVIVHCMSSPTLDVYLFVARQQVVIVHCVSSPALVVLFCGEPTGGHCSMRTITGSGRIPVRGDPTGVHCLEQAIHRHWSYLFVASQQELIVMYRPKITALSRYCVDLYNSELYRARKGIDLYTNQEITVEGKAKHNHS